MMMQLTAGNLPWARGLGALGATVAMVVGGAVTTAGAIDDQTTPEGPQATVQILSSDEAGTWYACDLAIDLDGPGPAWAMTALEGEDGSGVFGVTVGEVEVGEMGEAPVGAVEVGEAAVGDIDEVPVDAAVPTFEIELPEPSEIRPGTAEECAGVAVAAPDAAAGGASVGTAGGGVVEQD